MAELKRKKGETFESLLRRFSKKVQESGVVLQYKKIRFHQSPITKNKRRESTLIRKKLNAQKEYLQKIGKLPEDDYKSSNRK